MSVSFGLIAGGAFKFAELLRGFHSVASGGGRQLAETGGVPGGGVAIGEDGGAEEDVAGGVVAEEDAAFDHVGGAFLNETIGECELGDVFSRSEKDGDRGGIDTDDFAGHGGGLLVIGVEAEAKIVWGELAADSFQCGEMCLGYERLTKSSISFPRCLTPVQLLTSCRE